MSANDSKIILGKKPDGTYTAVKVDENGNLVITGSAGGSSAVQISDGSVTATITDVSGKKSLDVNVTDITINKDNDSITTHAAQLTTRLDDTSTLNMTYVGEANIGSAESSAVWRIKRIDETSGIKILYADGDSNFNNIWNNRTSLTYS
jgi:hypothetical protein